MLETPTRNHPTIMIHNLFLTLIVMLSIFVPFLIEGLLVPLMLSSVLIAIFVAFIVIFWAKTTIVATENELISDFNFIMHRHKVVPYSKIASVNVVRNLFNRIFDTAIIQVNINSSINAARPEISICLKNESANQLRDQLSSRIYGLNYSSEVEHVYESSVNLSNRDAILHGIFGRSSWYIVHSLFFILLSIVFMVFESRGNVMALVSTSLLFAFSFALPMVLLVIRYYNFRVYRLGDTIYLQHGAIQLYKTSFKVNKINSVRVRRTLFARLMNKACLEVDVVGINATEDTTPVLCILTSMENVQRLMEDVVPDFIYEREGERQPSAAKVPWLRKAFWASCATVLVFAYPLWLFFLGDVSSMGQIESNIGIIRVASVGGLVLLIAIYFAAAYVGFIKNRLDVGEDMFMFETGIVDRVRTVMQYDRAQIVDIYAWPSARKRGLARCRVWMLSSSGRSMSISGYYPVERLEAISEEVLTRIKDGRYDYGKSVI